MMLYHYFDNEVDETILTFKDWENEYTGNRFWKESDIRDIRIKYETGIEYKINRICEVSGADNIKISKNYIYFSSNFYQLNIILSKLKGLIQIISIYAKQR